MPAQKKSLITPMSSLFLAGASNSTLLCLRFQLWSDSCSFISNVAFLSLFTVCSPEFHFGAKQAKNSFVFLAPLLFSALRCKYLVHKSQSSKPSSLFSRSFSASFQLSRACSDLALLVGVFPAERFLICRRCWTLKVNPVNRSVPVPRNFIPIADKVVLPCLSPRIQIVHVKLLPFQPISIQRKHSPSCARSKPKTVASSLPTELLDRLSVDVPLNCFVSLHSPSQHLPSFPALRKNGVRQPVHPTQPRLLQGTSLSELLPYFDFLIGGSFACMVPIKFHDAPLPLASEGCCFSLALSRQQIGAFKVDWIVCGFHLCSISLATCKVCGGLLIFDLPLQCYTSGFVSFAAGSCTCLAPLAITDRFLDCASSNLQCHAITLQPSCDAVTLEVNTTCSLDLATLANELLHVSLLAIPVHTDLGRERER